jgi:hypothetical protein
VPVRVPVLAPEKVVRVMAPAPLAQARAKRAFQVARWPVVPATLERAIPARQAFAARGLLPWDHSPKTAQRALPPADWRRSTSADRY